MPAGDASSLPPGPDLDDGVDGAPARAAGPLVPTPTIAPAPAEEPGTEPAGEPGGNGAAHHPDGTDGADGDGRAPDDRIVVPGWPTEPTEPPGDEPDPVERNLRLAVDVLVVAACALFVFLQLGPSNIFADTTPAGGDMGAHVWGPAYLRDHLLPDGRIAGWSPDWYAGFPAYQFYMVVPSLAIVALDLGLQGLWALIPLVAAVAAAVVAVRSWRVEPRRRNLALVGVGAALLCVGLPYGVAFKLVSVSGAIGLPVAAYAFGRLAGLRFPTPAMLAVATLPFLFYRGFSIYGGNLASTLAGEFAFSISLSIGLVYLGVVFRGLETGKHRALGAGLLALTGLCHLIPAFWVITATLLIVVVRPRHSRETLVLPAAVAGAVAVVLGTVWWMSDAQMFATGAFAALGVATVLWLALSRSFWAWMVPVGMVGGLLSSFWVVPFALRHTYVNDMGWEKLPYFGQEGESWSKYLFPSDNPDVDLRWAFGLAMVGLGLSLALRLRPGIFLGMITVVSGVAFWLMPEGRLWNGRLLPFYYLTVLLLAALAVAEAVRLIVELANPGRSAGLRAGASTVVPALAVTLLVVGLPLGVVPFDERIAPTEGSPNGYAWPSFSPWQLHGTDESGINVKFWANWNYSGYERKDAYREYYEVIQVMKGLGEDGGCGRALWEYKKEQDVYGTPMAMMLLPYWTDGCIGSMEGLYFEASTTTPFHFVMQTELSAAPSSAQRDMPYNGFDLTKGVQHLQMMGVRYYMAMTDQAVDAADLNPDLTKVASSGPWEIYEVADAPLVQPLANEPLVLEGVEPDQQGWLKGDRDEAGRFNGPSIQWFDNPALWDVQWSLGGPDSWRHVGWDELEQEIARGALPEARPLPQVEVDNVTSGDESISFDVDRVGTPVLVKTSYFPNWTVSGAEGPWRVAPNLMVVVPTDQHVELSYETTALDWLADVLTLLGLVALVLLARWGQVRFRGSERSARTWPPSPPPPAVAAQGVAAPGLAGPFTWAVRPERSTEASPEPEARPAPEP